ncbi:MAG: hypothetical protein GX051_07080 [Clostridiales bacterium]|nr:hypothetical protein [Clostridiales bacterium]
MKERLNFLTKKNGVALATVLVILFLLVLFVPILFNFSDYATASATSGTNRQKASYLARTGVEMTIAAYKKTRNDATYAEVYEDLREGTIDKIETERIYLLMNDAGDTCYASAGDNSADGYTAKKAAGYSKEIGYTDVTIEFDGEPTYFKTTENGQALQNPVEVTENEATTSVTKEDGTVVNNVIKSGYMKLDYDRYIFTGLADVNGKKSSRKAYATETKDPEEEGWLLDADVDVGGGQLFVNPDKASAKEQVNYTDELLGANLAPQDLLTYSTIGSMKIESDALGINGVPAELGIWPGLLYWENNPANNILRGYNYSSYSDDVQVNNFLSFNCTKTLQIDVPVNLLVNGPRCGNGSYRMGDGAWDLGLLESLGIGVIEKNASLFKIMMLQGQEIVLNQPVKVQMSLNSSFYGGNGTTGVGGKRFGTIVLSAPNSTPYTYKHEVYGKVKAGVLYLGASGGIDIYFLDPDENTLALGSEAFRSNGNSTKGIGSNKGGFMSEQTVYRVSKDDFTIRGSIMGGTTSMKFTNLYEGNANIPICFRPGDVYYFNAEKKDTEGDVVGISIVNWYCDVYYFNEVKSRYQVDTDSWTKVGKFLKTWYNNLIDALITGIIGETTYVKDDIHYIGNTITDTTLIKPVADIENELYIVWED